MSDVSCQKIHRNFGFSEFGILIFCCVILVLSTGVNAATPFQITQHPENVSVSEGGTIKAQAFVRMASGYSIDKLRVYWYNDKDKVEVVPSATGKDALTLSIANAKLASAGTYRCMLRYEKYQEMCDRFTVSVSKGSDSSTSSSASSSYGSYTLTGSGSLKILKQPSSVAATAGQRVSFEVIADGAPPIYYQWRYEGEVISGENSNVLTLSKASSANAGEYKVIVMNKDYAQRSNAAQLTVYGQASGSALVSWKAPTRRSDGSALASGEISKYRLYRYINNVKSLHSTIGASTTRVEINNLSSGYHYFALATVDTGGAESSLSSKFTVKIN